MLCIYKICNVSVKTWKENSINIIIIKNEEDKREVWIKMRDMQHKLGMTNMFDLTIKQFRCIYNKKRKYYKTRK